MTNSHNHNRRLITLRDWAKLHGWPTEKGLRQMLYKDRLGFSNCIVRIGTRVLIDEELFFRWLEENQIRKHAPAI